MNFQERTEWCDREDNIRIGVREFEFADVASRAPPIVREHRPVAVARVAEPDLKHERVKEESDFVRWREEESRADAGIV